MRNDYDELGREFSDQWRFLGALFEESDLPQEDSGAGMTPILDSIGKQSKRYADPVLAFEGGEKKIFKVRDLFSDRIVAYAQPISSATGQEKEQFLREARLTARLQHPNIVSVYDQGVDSKGEPFFAMEYMRGDTLKEIIERIDVGDDEYRMRFPRSRLMELFVKICDALAYAHSLGVVHLDVKPANINVGPFGEVLLCDWGLARILQPDQGDCSDLSTTEDAPDINLLNDLNLGGLTKGTPGFMAPEQVESLESVSVRSDVYAIGALLYYMLTYQPPVVGKSAHERLKKTQQCQIIPPAKLFPLKNIPAGLEAVAMKALSLDPVDRYPSVRILRDELDRYLHGFSTLAQRAGFFTRLGLLIRRRPVAFQVAGISLVLLLLIFSIALVKVVYEKEQAINARVVAEEMRDESNTARHRAEDSLRLYEKENLERKRLSRKIQTAAKLMAEGSNFMRASAKSTILEMQLGKEHDPEEKSAIILQLAMLHFVQQNFQEATSYFSRIELNSTYRIFDEIARDYAGKKKADDQWLKPSDLRDIVVKIPSWCENICYALTFYYFRDTGEIKLQDPQKLLPLVEAVLDKLNHRGMRFEKIDELSLEKTEDGWNLSISGKPYSVFVLPVSEDKNLTNILKALGLNSLDISYSGVISPWNLRGSAIRVLDITGLTSWSEPQVRHLSVINTLKTVYHSLPMSDEFLKEVHPNVDFIRVGPKGNNAPTEGLF